MSNSDKNSDKNPYTEPTSVKKDDQNDYAYDGEVDAESPNSPGKRRMAPDGDGDEDGAVITACDRATNVLAVGMLVMVAVASVVSIVAGSMQLASLSGKEFHRFSLFFAMGVAPVAVGSICMAGVVLVTVFISFFSMGLGKYGMCFYGASRGRGALRVGLLGVFPFAVFCALVAVATMGFGFYSISQSLPQLDKSVIEVEGLSGPIQIVRDVNGLTHIRASSRRDAFVGQGFAEAQDRLFQLEFHRMVAQGKLSSIVGVDGLATDKSVRTINVRDAAISMCETTAPEEIDNLAAFAEGVNLFLTNSKKRPVEFFFMGKKSKPPLQFHNPEPFSARDVCLTARIFMWQMTSNLANEGLRFTVWAGSNRNYTEMEEIYWNFDDNDTVLTREQMKDIIKENEPDLADDDDSVESYISANILNDLSNGQIEGQFYDSLLDKIRQALKSGSIPLSAVASPHEVVNNAVATLLRDHFYQQQDTNIFAHSFIHASNAWAARSEEGHTIVASDPHLTTNLPSLWYYTHLSFPSDEATQYDIAGVSLVGLPGVHIGKTTTQAWGITMSMSDLQDLFVLPPQMLTGFPDRTYRYANENRVFTRRRERIHVKGQEDTVLEVDDTLLGPIISEMLGLPSIIQIVLYAVPLRLGDNESVRALMATTDPSVKSAPELMQRLLHLHAPGFSIPIGDIHGNLAYAVTGRHPVRNLGHTGKYPTVAMDFMGAFLTLLFSGGIPTDLPDLINRLRPFLQSTSYETYVSADPNVPDKTVPSSYNPHAVIPFDPKNPKAAHISACNQKIVPAGYPHNLAADFALPFRAHRLHELLDANMGKLGDLETHRRIQMDSQSNIWAYGYRAVVAGDVFQALIKDDEKAKKWADRLLEWDMKTPVGSVETAFFWRWLQRMAVLPRDVVQASGLGLYDPQMGWGLEALVGGAFPSSRFNKDMQASCAAEPGIGPSTYQDDSSSSKDDSSSSKDDSSSSKDDSSSSKHHKHRAINPCLRFAAKTFKEQAASGDGFKERWGIDLNNLRGLHEMLEQKPIIPVFRREMHKSGDSSTLSVSGNGIVGNMLSSQAPSMRLLFDLWKDVDHVQFFLPGGNSGNPYSKFYQNMWDKYAKDEYTTVVATEKAWDTIDKAHDLSIGQ